jgi:ABC-type sugar transport system permease subunit
MNAATETSLTLAGVQKKRTMRRWITKHAWPFMFLSPAMVIYGSFFIFPFLFSLYLSFMQWNLVSPNKEFVGIDNYAALFADPVFWISLKNTIFYVLGTVPLSMILGLAMAILVEAAGRFREVYRFLFFVPVVASIAVVSIVWTLLFSPNNGLISNFLQVFGVQGPNWLNDPNWAMWALILVGVWKAMGYNMVLYIAGLKSIDRQLYEAAQIDGAGRWMQFRSITLPLLSPVTFFVMIVSIINSFQVFATIHIMTRGGPNNATNVLVYEVWQEAFQFFDIGKASALSMVLFLLVLAITVVQIRMTESKVHYQ